MTVCLRVCEYQRGPGEPNQAFRLGGLVNTTWRLALVGSEDHPLSVLATWPSTLTVSVASVCVSVCVCAPVFVCMCVNWQKSHQLLSETFGC